MWRSKRLCTGGGAAAIHQNESALPVSIAPIAACDDLRTVAVLDGVPGKEPDGRLVGGATDDQVGGAGQNFIMAVGPHDFEREVFWQHGWDSLNVGLPLEQIENDIKL
jgi:hypothetical protein